MTRPCKCGECSFFSHEDIDGRGYCRITERWPECSEECTFAKLWMTTKQSERVLHYLQKWRKGGRGRQPHPYVIGKAIDSALHILRRSRKRIINV